MAATIKFDVIKKAGVTTRLLPDHPNAYEVTIERNCVVTGIPLDAGDSDPSVLLKCFGLDDFPKLFTNHPDPNFAYCYVQGHRIDSFNVSKDTVDATIIYRGPFVPQAPGGGIFFQLTQTPVTNVVDWYATQGLTQNLRIWYGVSPPSTPDHQSEPGPGPTDIVDGATPLHKLGDGGAGGAVQDLRNFKTHKIRVEYQLKATAAISRSLWNTNKVKLQSLRGAINSKAWGDYERGKWLALGPATQTLDSSGSFLRIELIFLKGEPDWYPVEVYRDLFGNIPNDVRKESEIRAKGLPDKGSQKNANGVTLASIYDEVDFNQIVGFVPE